MSVSTGHPAPSFTLYDSDREPFGLTDAGRPLVLLFFPGAFTSVCTTELNTVANDYSAYEALGAEVVGISTDSPFALAEYKRVHGFPFRLLSDHDGEVAAAYGAKYNNDFTPMNLGRIAKRAAFVIVDGQIRYAEVLESAGDMPDLDAVKRSLQDG